MEMLVALHHVTHYRYDRPVEMGMQTIRLRPAPHTRAHIQSYSLRVTPAEHFINWQQDPFGNYMASVVFPQKVCDFSVVVDVVTEIRVFNPFDFFLESYATHFPFAYPPLLKEELSPYCEIKEHGEQLMKLLADVDQSASGTIDFLVKVNQHLHQKLRYVVRMEPGVQSYEETLNLGSGSCRDMAWLLCQLLRHLGFATRFASGYLIQLRPDVKPLEGPAGTDHDFTDLHAWTEVYLPGAGWVGLDPTSGLFAGEGHIPLCCTPNPSSAAPISGTLESCESTLEHKMSVTRIREGARVTRPYTQEQWQQIDALGAAVDKALHKQDVRLTMGGEPTFVSDEDRTGSEWHFAALGGKKKELASELLTRLKTRFTKGALLQHTQGKWYPGELLPRWAMNCYWRSDGQPVWRDEALLAAPDAPQGHTLETAKLFSEKLAEALGIPASYLLAAREDAPYYLWKEQRLPIEGDIMTADLHENAERQRLQKLMDSKLGAEAGYVLPLHFSPTRKRWISNRWKFRTEHMVLLPGDSPVGLRLPLGSLPTPKGVNKEFFPERSPFKQNKSLPSHDSFAGTAEKRSKKPDDSSFAQDENGLIKSALCAQVREGTLYVFLPPLAYIEHFLDLIASIEQVASSLRIPLVLEGYAPPSDLRLLRFSVTPDPGVIEVNVHPAANWQELKAITTGVYEEATQTKLSAEKFLIDGKRVGTGGGNHIVMGAHTPDDSPFLRRPDVLRSLITFWQHHPCLSYLFAGLYIGPTSQSPRIDEARHDSLGELEIAFAQIPEKGEVPHWLVDRLLRNLLVDLTGNTHRAEFCIDKLYTPESERGRLGLLEMRGFEMTPHPQMNLLQALLLRACIAHFWKTPYTHRLIRWGTTLHDKFMLPHFVRHDLHEVLEHLRTGGFHFAPEWFEPFFAFRFPRYGSVRISEAQLELHMALEPWPVMGEEMSAGGTSRSVDSSVERVQVSVRGLHPQRHTVTCNGHPLPLIQTSEHDLHVAAVRYKAWAPPSSLHPNIKVHTPLVFDIIDNAYGRSLGGCTYHVMHPGGRSYETLPVNANEAEGRCLSRFEPMGHTPGKLRVHASMHNPDFPCTLDLRKVQPK
jgi:uncharacterized protein (DUF2126 family)/transglutaminase-like putative cysteine protease